MIICIIYMIKYKDIFKVKTRKDILLKYCILWIGLIIPGTNGIFVIILLICTLFNYLYNKLLIFLDKPL